MKYNNNFKKIQLTYSWSINNSHNVHPCELNWIQVASNKHLVASSSIGRRRKRKKKTQSTYLWHSETLGVALGTSSCSGLSWAHLQAQCAHICHRCSMIRPRSGQEQKSEKWWYQCTQVLRKHLASHYGWPCGKGQNIPSPCNLAIQKMCDNQGFHHFSGNTQTWTTIVLENQSSNGKITSSGTWSKLLHKGPRWHEQNAHLKTAQPWN